MFNKILVPLDGSELASKAISPAEDLAKLNDAQLVLMTVGSSPASAPGTAAEAQSRVEKYLAETAAGLQAENLKATWVYKQGTPAHEIVAYAADQKVDLIVLASHGAGEIAWLLGSVAQKVISHAPCPVLLIRVLQPKPPEHKSELDYFSM